jgi:hypothetical protein
MRLWKRIWCWIVGHDWVQLLRDPWKAVALQQFHELAGCMGYCARCGYLWDDLRGAEHYRPDLGEWLPKKSPRGAPYRTAPPLPPCKCARGKIHPDCPRHYSPAESEVSSTVTRTVTIKITVNGKDVPLSDDAAKEVEAVLDDFEKTFERQGEVIKRGFAQFDEMFGKLDRLFKVGSRVERVKRTRTRDPKDVN